jgi:hypothetical protein
MLAQYRYGRQADALATYTRARHALVLSAGVEPGQELRLLHEAVLRQDPALQSGIWHPGGSRLTVRSRCPFKGLLPYDEDDAALLIGRERVVDKLVGRLERPGLTCLTGASGAGKSSTLRAGLLAAVRAGALRGSEGWSVRVIERGAGPLGSIGETVTDPPELLVFDQVEEALAPVGADARRDLAAGLAKSVSACARVVCCVRSDYWWELAAEPAIAELLPAGTVVIGPLTADELRRVVTAGAGAVGLTADPGLVEELVIHGAGEVGALPLVSTALARTRAHRTTTA